MNPVHIAAALKAMGTTAATVAADLLIVRRQGKIIGINKANMKLLTGISALYATKKFTISEGKDLKNILAHRPDNTLPMPYHNHNDDAGYDLIATENVDIAPGDTVVLLSNIKLAIPKGYFADIRPRSGISNMGVLVHPGTIDSGYRNVVKFTVTNLSKEDFRVRRSDRIAQLIIIKHESVKFTEVEELPEGDRGQLGFGSSGGFQS